MHVGRARSVGVVAAQRPNAREQRSDARIVARAVGAQNERLQRRVNRSAHDGEAVKDEIALRERETRRAEKFRRLGEPFL